MRVTLSSAGGGMSGRRWRETSGGQSAWWLRDGGGDFIDVPFIEGREKFDGALDLDPGTYVLGTGTRQHGARIQVDIPAETSIAPWWEYGPCGAYYYLTIAPPRSIPEAVVRRVHGMLHSHMSETRERDAAWLRDQIAADVPWGALISDEPVIASALI